MIFSDLHCMIEEEFQKEIEEFFAFSTGFGVVFVDNNGRHLGEGSNFTRFCRCINESPETVRY